MILTEVEINRISVDSEERYISNLYRKAYEVWANENLSELESMPFDKYRITFPIEIDQESKDSYVKNQISIENGKALGKKRLQAYSNMMWNEEKAYSFDLESYQKYVVRCLKQECPKFIIDEDNAEVVNLLSLYFLKHPDFEKKGYSLDKGILLYGDVGCGKTLLMHVLRMNPNRCYRVCSARDLVNRYNQSSDEKKSGMDIIEYYSGSITPSTEAKQKWGHSADRSMGLMIDDIGTEEAGSNFGVKKNVIEQILMNRYDRRLSKDSTHATTNLKADQLKLMYGERAASRMREMFNQISFPTLTKDRRS